MLVELQAVVKRYKSSGGGDVTAVSDVQLKVDAGEFLAVSGPSGCGKSTLLLITGGLLKPDSGAVTVAGKSLYDLSPSARAQFRAQTIGFVFQQFHLVPYLSVVDNIMAARLGVGGSDGGASISRATELIAKLGLSDRKRHRPGQLSTGERQRTALARALLNQPKLLLADEPTGNLDRENADAVLRQLREFTDQGGAVMLVTHDSHAVSYADRSVQVQKGVLATPGA